MIESPEDFKELQVDAQRQACYHLKQIARCEQGLPTDALAKAMYFAGQASAMFQTRCVVEALEEKLAQARKRKPPTTSGEQK